MSGYQETLTDPSFCDQIVVMTYPLVGNYGCCKLFDQSDKCWYQGFIVSELCDEPSNWRNEESLPDFLERMNVPVLVGVDTRAITRKIRSYGTLQGVIVPSDMPQEEIDKLLATPEVHASQAYGQHHSITRFNVGVINLPKTIVEAKVIGQQILSKDVKLIEVFAPEIARTAKPGQFVNVQVSKQAAPLLRRPFGVAGIDYKSGTFKMIYRIMGEGTQILAELCSGDVISIIGPLGHEVC